MSSEQTTHPNENKWIEAIVDRVQEETQSDGAELIIFNHQENEFYPFYSNLSHNIIDKLEGNLREVIYNRDTEQKTIDSTTYNLFPITTEMGPIGVLLFENASTTEGFGIVGALEQTVGQATSIIGKILTDELYDEIGSLGVNSKGNNPEEIDTILPVGEHQCVVMFINFRSLTRLLDICDNKSVIFEIIEDFVEIIGTQARKHHGVVNKYMGASALLLFGVSIDDSIINDDKRISTLRALCTAAKIQERFQRKEPEWYDRLRSEIGKEIFEDVFQDVDIGIGINSQTPRLLTVGEQERYDYSCFGKEVTLAKEIESVSGRKEHKGSGWDEEPGYCSIMFSTIAEHHLSDLVSDMNGNLNIDIIQGPKEVYFPRFGYSRNLNTFKEIKIKEPAIDPSLEHENTIITHEPTDSSLGKSVSNQSSAEKGSTDKNYTRWEVRFSKL